MEKQFKTSFRDEEQALKAKVIEAIRDYIVKNGNDGVLILPLPIEVFNNGDTIRISRLFIDSSDNVRMVYQDGGIIEPMLFYMPLMVNILIHEILNIDCVIWDFNYISGNNDEINALTGTDKESEEAVQVECRDGEAEFTFNGKTYKMAYPKMSQLTTTDLFQIEKHTGVKDLCYGEFQYIASTFGKLVN